MVNQKFDLKPQLFVGVVTMTCRISIGGLLSLSGILIPALQAEEDPNLKISLKDGSWMVTVWPAMAIFGSMLGGWIADTFGRRSLLLMCQLPISSAWGLIASAPSYWVILIAMGMSGFGNGALNSAASVYLCEISHPKVRGMMANLLNIAQSIGMLLSYVLGAYLPWRFLCWTLFGFSLVSAVLITIFTLETPYYLLTKLRVNEARNNLQKLRGPTTNIDEEFNEILERKLRLEANKLANQISTKSIFTSSRFLRPFFGAGVTFILACFSGIMVISLYTVNVFQESGSSLDPYLGSILVMSFRTFTSLVGSIVLTVFKRRHLLLCSSLIISSSLFLMGGSNYIRRHFFHIPIEDKTLNGTWLESNSTHDLSEGFKPALWVSTINNWIPLLAMMTMYAAHSMGFGALLKLSCAEAFPTEIRSKASAIVFVFVDIALAGVGKAFPYMLEAFEFYGTFWIFALTTALTGIYGFVTMVESKGKTLVMIEEQFEEKRMKRKNLVLQNSMENNRAQPETTQVNRVG
ncbi:facilitated trehalose transporter Tret1-like [Tigriopus californicus]|uniref:facilitated trehalose transporter Tret1-like n=1 Tax=Tigriopus californicus TaxID=6832 RepID=UPI0027DA12E5|nr:facilitated trehalose transporter Tret1-like [Tigriopus californicus]